MMTAWKMLVMVKRSFNVIFWKCLMLSTVKIKSNLNVKLCNVKFNVTVLMLNFAFINE